MIIPENAHIILDRKKALLKLDRIAFQILEKTYNNDEIVLIGIKDGGYILANKIMKLIQQYDAAKKIHLASVYINKQNPLAEDIVLEGIDDLNNKTIILIDDVANTGKTMFYVFKKLISFNINQLITCVLIDRTHKKFPIQSDIVGLQMATTFSEHIIVKFSNNKIEDAYLF